MTDPHEAGGAGSLRAGAPGRRRPDRGTIAACSLVAVLLVAVTLAAYWPVTGYRFLNYDDDLMVWRNPPVRQGLTVEGLRWALTTFHGSNWVPLTWLSHMFDVQLFGLSAERHHLVNLLLHAANGVLAFLVLAAATGARWRSALVAALFVLHPQRVESVAWVAERKDMLFVFFGLLTVAAYLFHARRPGWPRMLPVCLCLALGLAAKSMLMTLPVALLLLDFWPLGRMRAGAHGVTGWRLLRWRAPRGLIAEKTPLFLLSLAAFVLNAFAQQDALVPLADYPVDSRVANMLNAGLSYVSKSLWPRDLAVLYPLPTAFSIPRTLGALALLACLTTLAVRQRRRRPAMLVGWLFFLVTLAPVSGLAPLGFQAMADRFTYFPHLGLFIAAVWLVGEIAAGSRLRNAVAAALSLAAVAALAAMTARQVGYWSDDERLFRHALAAAPRNHVALSNLANALIEKGRLEEGVEVTREALALRPREAVAHNNMGIALARLGRLEEARARFETALQIDPNYAPAMLNLGKLDARQRRFANAVETYRRALPLLPDSPDVRNDLGMALAGMNRLDEARQVFEEALRIDPTSRGARANLDVVMRRLRDPAAPAHP